MFELIKKAARWYFRKAAETYAWMPTGTLPSPNL